MSRDLRNAESALSVFLEIECGGREIDLDELTDEIEWRLADLVPGGAVAVGPDGSLTVCADLSCPPRAVAVFEAGAGVTRRELHERLRRKVRAGLLTLS